MFRLTANKVLLILTTSARILLGSAVSFAAILKRGCLQLPFSFDKSLLDNVDVGIVVYDKDGLGSVCQRDPSQIQLLHVRDFQHFNTYDIYRSKVSNICLFDKAVKTKRPATAIQHTYHGRDDSSYDKLVTAIPILDEFGNISNVVSTFVDLNDFHTKYNTAQRESNITYDMSSSKKYQAQVIYGSGEMQRLLDTAKSDRRHGCSRSDHG